MFLPKKENLVIILILAVSVLIFLSSGLHHLSKFETVDEHFWKFERIPQYWKALEEHNFKKTYINDKPGVSVALISGIGLLTEPEPENLRMRDTKITQNNLLTVYDSKKTEDINFALRFPILLFNSLFLLYFFWIIKKITESDWIAVFSVAFVAVSPILVGISQIINPDSLLWIFTTAAIFSYFALLKTDEKKFLFLTAFFTGMSLLSKYSATILFPFYFFIFFSEYFINFEKYKEITKKYFSRNILRILIIFLGSLITFSIFLPAVFIKAKYLYRGTIGAPGFSIIALPLLIFIFLILLDTLLLRNYSLKKIGSWLCQKQQAIFKISSALITLIFILVIFNVWTGQKLVPFDKLIADIYQNGKEIFDGVLLNTSAPIKISKELLLQFYPFIFSQLPLLLAIVFIFWIKAIFKGVEKYKNYIFFCSAIPIIYFLALIFSNVLANIRYSIMLYPLFAFLGALAIVELRSFLEKILKAGTQKIYVIFSIFILLSGLTALWFSKPFYFNYTNFLLPQQFIITDSWGYGAYEAAEYLNSLPNSSDIKVWTDRTGICQFLKGSCLTSRKIDLNIIKPDYFIFSKRGSVRTQFIWKYPELAKRSVAYYYTKGQVVWSLFIDDRPENFVKIIKAEE